MPEATPSIPTPAPLPDPSGLPRTPDGTLADPPSNPNTPPEPKTPDGATLLNQNEPAPDPAQTPPPKDTPKPAATGAPENYADYTLPEGFELGKETKAEADKIFKSLNLDQAQAQSLVDFYVAKTQDSAKQPYEAYKTLTDSWRDAALKHPEIGNKILPGGEINVRIARALDNIGDPQLAKDFRELMDLTGAGNNQAFIRVIDKLASRGVEGTHVAGTGPTKEGQRAPGEGPVTAAKAMYPHLPSQNG
jgi:hypothetical protein